MKSFLIQPVAAIAVAVFWPTLLFAGPGGGHPVPDGGSSVLLLAISIGGMGVVHRFFSRNRR